MGCATAIKSVYKLLPLGCPRLRSSSAGRLDGGQKVVMVYQSDILRKKRMTEQPMAPQPQ